jgi:hypothetical protein
MGHLLQVHDANSDHEDTTPHGQNTARRDMYRTYYPEAAAEMEKLIGENPTIAEIIAWKVTWGNKSSYKFATVASPDSIYPYLSTIHPYMVCRTYYYDHNNDEKYAMHTFYRLDDLVIAKLYA